MGIQRFGGLKVGYLCWVLFSAKMESGSETERRKQTISQLLAMAYLRGAEQRKSILGISTIKAAITFLGACDWAKAAEITWQLGIEAVQWPSIASIATEQINMGWRMPMMR